MTMTLTIDDVSLPQFTIDIDHFYRPAVEAVAKPTRGGTKLRWPKRLKHVPFDIVSPDDVFCDGDTLNELREWAESIVTLGATYSSTLSIQDTDYMTAPQTYTVRLRFEDVPVISAKPVIETCPQSSGNVYSGLRIKLDRILS